jgi:tRNA(adenine34) deaminase
VFFVPLHICMAVSPLVGPRLRRPCHHVTVARVEHRPNGAFCEAMEEPMFWTDTDQHFMRRAIALARSGEDNPGKNPIGCVIVRNGTIIGEGCNEVDQQHDATAHAEIVSMRRAGAALNCHELRDAVLYTTLQPCGMCTMASIWAKIGRIVYGAGRDDVHEMYFEDRHLDTLDFIRDAFRNDLSIEGGLLVKDCVGLYVPAGADIPKDEWFNR